MRVKKIWIQGEQGSDSYSVHEVNKYPASPTTIELACILHKWTASISYPDGRIEYFNLYNALAWGYTPLDETNS